MSSQPLSDYVVILVVHLLRDVRGFAAALREVGLQPESTFIVNIPYSTKQEAIAALWVNGFRNLYLSAEYPIDDAVDRAIQSAMACAHASGRQVLVIEDGGYVGPRLHEAFQESLPLIRGIVEQTQNGIWQYEERNITPALPVVSVASCELKKDKESPLIGRAIVGNVEALVENKGFSLSRYEALVVGFGATGKHVASEFKRRYDNPVRVFDQDPARRTSAESEGFITADDLNELTSQSGLIVACTGKASFDAEAIMGLRDECIFANGSSKRRELDWDEVKNLSQEVTAIPNVGTRYHLTNGHRIEVLADGYPVNFVGESVPDEEISFVYGLLFRSVLWCADTTLEAGIVDVPREIQEEIARDHEMMLPHTEGRRPE